MPRRIPVSSGASGSDNASTSNNNNEAANPESVTVDDRAPLWMFVKKISNYGTGGSRRWQCNFCKNYYNGSHTRVEKHLLKEGGHGINICTKVNPQATAQIRKLLKDCKERIANRAARPVPLPSSTSQGSSATRGSYSVSYGDYTAPTIASEGKKRRAAGGPLEKAFQNAAREECYGEIARMFYTGGLSFNLARNPHFRNSYMRASTLPGFVPPGYNALRTTLLDKERKNLEYQLEPLKLTWRDKGVSICSDGWSDPQRKPLINMMAICESGPMMLKAVNCEGEYKDFNFIAELLTESIKQVGYQNVVQVVTDNAPVCAKAGALIASKYPTIFWTPCVVHTLNLALKNICTPSHAANNVDVYAECSWIQPVVEDVMFIKNFIMNHGMRLVMFNDHCHLKLLSVAPTRFASAVIMLKRFKTIKNGLQQMVISTKWDDYREDDSRKAGRVKEMLLDDFMWDNIEYILSFTEPIYEMIRKADTDKPCLHLVYEWWDDMMEQVKKVIYRKERKQFDEESPFWDVVHKILLSRWSKATTPLHCLAHSLNPKYYSPEWLDEASHHVAPHKDLDVTRERKNCFLRYFANEDDRRKANIEYAHFSMCMQGFGGGDVIKDRSILEPLTWWVVHGSSAPTLQAVAFKLLGQPSSSSCCERNWSTYNFIHSLPRNKLAPQRAEDLVFVHTNLRLLARQSSSYNKGATHMWDVGGDAFDSLEDTNVGILEVAELSLDEPVLMAVLFDDDDNDDDDEFEEELNAEDDVVA